MKDIAREAGVSMSTVSKALNNKGRINASLRHKIIRLAGELGYQPFIKSRQNGMYAGHVKYIGVIFPFADEHLSREIQRGIDASLTDNNFFQIRLSLNDASQVNDETRKEDFLDNALRDKPFAGLIAVFFTLMEATVANLEKRGIAVVQLNHNSPYGSCVAIDNADAAYQAVKSLIDLGRKKIGLIMPEEKIEQAWQERLDGYKRALKEGGIGYNPYYIVYEHTFELKNSARATKALLEREPGIDAIVYGSDTQAYGGLEGLREMNLRVPDDIAVIGFDDLPFSQLTKPPLTSVNQPMFEMGKTGSQILLDAVRNKDFTHKNVLLKSKLVLRQSTHKNIPGEKIL